MGDLADAQQRARTRRRAAKMRQKKRARQRRITCEIGVSTARIALALAQIAAFITGLNAGIADALDDITVKASR